MSFLVTGSSGFIGSHLLCALNSSAASVSSRKSCWVTQIKNQSPSVIVHLAGSSHGNTVDNEVSRNNVGLTIELAKEAVSKRVKRFIFLSSIQAVTDKTSHGEQVNTDTSPLPRGSYGKSKLEAEKVLRQLSMQSRMEVVIIRSPLVYGPGVKANFRNLFKLVDNKMPLPLNAFECNQRSFVSVTNLVDLILLCLEDPAAANQTFHVSDGDDVSTAELLRRMGRALGKPVRNLPIPQSILKIGLQLAGKGEWVDKLFGDLRVDISKTKRLLGWQPKVTMEEELARTAYWWRTRKE